MKDVGLCPCGAGRRMKAESIRRGAVSAPTASPPDAPVGTTPCRQGGCPDQARANRRSPLHRAWWPLTAIALSTWGLVTPALAQPQPDVPPQEVTPPRQEDFAPLPVEPEEDIPSLEELDRQFQPPAGDPTVPPSDEFVFTRFELRGSQAFDDAALTAAIQERVIWPSDRPASFPELAQIVTATQTYYQDNGRLFGGFDIAITAEGVLVLTVQEWAIADIEVTGLRRLRSGYVSSRLALAAGTPVDIQQLQDALRLLNSDPLIQSFAANLGQGTTPNTAVLRLDVTEAETFSADLSSNNGRSPSIGAFQRGIQFREGNLLGLGDSVSLSYNGTDGSNSLSVGYTVPVSPYNTTLSFSYSTSDSRIIQPPFDIFDIRSTARYYDLTLRHPLIQTPTEELALGLTFSRWETESRFLGALIGQSVPLETLGSDDQGRTRLSVLRFSQEWTQRGADRVLALRSQFNLGLDALDATINDQAPDGRFLSWRGQGQYIQLLAPDTLLLLRGTVQLGDRPLVPLEQFALGGAGTVRGYRRDAVTADNGVFFSAEARFPILRVPELGNGVLQVAPFVDVGRVWTSGELQPALGTLAAIGLGLRWQSEGISAQLDWGLPLTETQVGMSNLRDNSLQFSLIVSPF
jgi:hemolysin activation/secretion protein